MGRRVASGRRKKKEREERGNVMSLGRHGMWSRKVMGDWSGAWPGPFDSIFGGARMRRAVAVLTVKEEGKKRPGGNTQGGGGERRRGGGVGWVFRAVEW